MSEVERVGVIVLAGGASRRFGRDKLAEPIEGTPLLERSVAAAEAVAPAVDVVVVAAKEGRPVVPGGGRLVHDEVDGQGPLAGLVAGLGAIDPGAERVVVVAGDMPDLVPAVLRILIDTLDGADAALLETGERVRALPMAVRRAPGLSAAAALFAAGERRLRSVPLALGASIVPSGVWRALDPDGRTLRDIDVEADLRRRQDQDA